MTIFRARPAATLVVAAALAAAATTTGAALLTGPAAAAQGCRVDYTANCGRAASRPTSGPGDAAARVDAHLGVPVRAAHHAGVERDGGSPAPA